MKSKIKISKDQFLQDVIDELINIKTHATFKEISRLDFLVFHPQSRDNCIYGQMTGDCRSDRACELILLCCKRYVQNPSNAKLYDTFSYLQPFINGTYVADNIDELKHNVGLKYTSSLEAFIMLRNEQYSHKKIFDFLEDKTQTIKL